MSTPPKIILPDYARNPCLEISLHPRRHNYSPDNIYLSRNADLAFPLEIEIGITPAGEIIETRWQWNPRNDNGYWHFSRYSQEACLGNDGYPWSKEHPLPPRHPRPTEMQLETLWRLWLGEITAWGITGSLGRPVASWAFNGYTPEELSQRFSGGKQVFLNNDDIDHRAEEAEEIRVALCEASLELACESGRMAGAQAADI